MPITTPNYYVVNNPSFQPQMMNILSITNANPAVITTTEDGINPLDNIYSTGLIVRIDVPNGFGMVISNVLSYPITVLTSSTFSIPLDTTSLDPFVVPSYNPGHNGTPAQVVPVGEVNDSLYQSTRNVLTPDLNP